MLFADSEVLSTAEAAVAVAAGTTNARPLLVCDPGRQPPPWAGDDIDVVAPSELASIGSSRLAVVDVEACETVVAVLRSLGADRLPDELGLIFDGPAPGPNARAATAADRFTADQRPVVWVVVLDDPDPQGLRHLWEQLDPVATLAVVPWPAVDPHRGDELIVAAAPLLETAGVGSGEIIHASDGTPLDLYRSLSALQEQLTATSPGARLVLTPQARDAHGLATALAAFEHGAELLTATRAASAGATPAPRVLWTARTARASAPIR